jgi:hypothetical protein
MLLPTCRTLDGFGLQSSDRRGLAITGLEPGVTLVVKTRYSSYRIVILDGAQRVVAVDGGIFPETTVVTLSGATFGGSALKVGWIVEGLRLEFCDGTRLITSSPVEAIEIESPSPVDMCRELVA